MVTASDELSDDLRQLSMRAGDIKPKAKKLMKVLRGEKDGFARIGRYTADRLEGPDSCQNEIPNFPCNGITITDCHSKELLQHMYREVSRVEHFMTTIIKLQRRCFNDPAVMKAKKRLRKRVRQLKEHLFIVLQANNMEVPAAETPQQVVPKDTGRMKKCRHNDSQYYNLDYLVAYHTMHFAETAMNTTRICADSTRLNIC